MQDLTALVRSALEEDVGPGDATTAATVDPDLRARGVITQKAPGVLYGMRVAELAFTLLDPQARAEYLAAEGRLGERVAAGLSASCSRKASCWLRSRASLRFSRSLY